MEEEKETVNEKEGESRISDMPITQGARNDTTREIKKRRKRRKMKDLK